MIIDIKTIYRIKLCISIVHVIIKNALFNIIYAKRLQVSLKLNIRTLHDNR